MTPICGFSENNFRDLSNSENTIVLRGKSIILNLKINVMKSNENALNWFDISVADISRAKKFYETVFWN